jgi:serine/threonine protein kinase
VTFSDGDTTHKNLRFTIVRPFMSQSQADLAPLKIQKNETPRPPSKESITTLKLLGQGAFGTVSLGKYRNKFYAIKSIPNCPLRESEINTLKFSSQLRHPNIVRFVRHFVENQTLHIVMEYVNGRSLADHLHGFPKVPERVLGRLAWLCLLALKYLRCRRVLHRDLKPANLLLSEDGEVKVCDFGIGAVLEASIEQRETRIGTMKYMSPERLRGNAYSFPADIWGLGMCLYEGALGKYPISDSTVNVFALCDDLEKLLDFDLVGYSPEFIDFLRQCLAIDPGNRLLVENAQDSWAAKFQNDGQADLQDWITSHHFT